MKIRFYLPNVLLTFFLIFLIIACEGSALVSRIALNPTTLQYITQRQQLDEKGYEKLTSYFKTRSNSTGIPEYVYLDAFSREDMHNAVWSNAEEALNYLNGLTGIYEPTCDFTALEASVRAFFEVYASENHVEKDDAYEEKIQSVLREAEAKILSEADPYQFIKLQKSGVLAKLRKVFSYLNTIILVVIICTAVVLILLFLCNLQQLEHLCYWFGLAFFISGGLTAAPCLYITQTDFFSKFAIKDPQVFSAVVGYLQLLTSRWLTIAIVTAIVGLIGLIGFIFLRAAQREENTENA